MVLVLLKVFHRPWSFCLGCLLCFWIWIVYTTKLVCSILSVAPIALFSCGCVIFVLSFAVYQQCAYAGTSLSYLALNSVGAKLSASAWSSWLLLPESASARGLPLTRSNVAVHKLHVFFFEYFFTVAVRSDRTWQTCFCLSEILLSGKKEMRENKLSVISWRHSLKLGLNSA